MLPLNLKSKNGEKFFHQDGLMYHEAHGSKVGVSIEYMIQVLSYNGYFPQIKFDRQYELIYDKPNKYVIGKTLHQAFCNLMITLFQYSQSKNTAMQELELYQFLKDNEVGMRWDDEVLSAWISCWKLAEFTHLISSALHDGGIDARLQEYGTVWVDLVPICEYYGIEPDRILPKS